MKISREQVIEFIRARGDDEHADRAQQELPDTLDLPTDEGILAQYGVEADDLETGGTGR
jgi:hypothetical protein